MSSKTSTSPLLSINTLLPALKIISSIEKGPIPRSWTIKINKDRFRSVRVTQDSILNLFKALDTEIISEEPGKIVLKIPSDLPLESYIEDKRASMIASFRPRLLTEEEITDIVSALPRVLSPIQEVSEKARFEIIERLKDQLSEIKITPLGIPDLKEAINYRFERARVEPGEAVGLTVAEALSALTQAALNAFHQSGARFNISTGIEMLQDLLSARLERKHESCNIHFNDKDMNFEQVFAKKVDFVSITVGDLISDYIIDNPENFEDYWWVSLYPSLTGKSLPKSSAIIRLELNKNRMYSHEVTMEDIVNAIESYNLPEMVKVVPGPFETGLIFVYPDENIASEPLRHLKIPTSDNVSQTFLNEILLPQLPKMQIKGISGIKSIDPTSVTTWSIVEDEIKMATPDVLAELNDPNEIDQAKRSWLLQLSRYTMSREGTRIDKLISLLETLDFTIIEIGETFIVVTCPNEEKPSKYVLAQISKSEDIVNKKRKDKIKNKPELADEIVKNSKYFYATSDGDNLKEIFSRPDVDTNYTTSNNPHTILNLLGIEAARNLLIQEFIFILENASLELDPRHIILLSDFMTNRGTILPISFWGMIRQNPGPLTVASFGKAISVFKTAAAFGQSEQIRTIASGMYVGQKGKFGSGYVDLRIDEEKLKELDKVISKEEEIPAQDLEAAIDQLDKVAFGAENEIQADPLAELAALVAPPPVQETRVGKGKISPPLEIVKAAPIMSTLAEKAIENIQVAQVEPTPEPSAPRRAIPKPLTRLSNLRKTTINAPAPTAIPKARLDTEDE